jgi:DNA-binding HxlR family transcriptional regulator
MSAKDNAAVIQLFDLLESRYALRVIWALSDGHPQTFRLLQDSVGGVTPNTLNTRLKQLRAARLVEHGGDGYRLTTQGADLARRLTEVQIFASRWSQNQARAAALVGGQPPPAPVGVANRSPG